MIAKKQPPVCVYWLGFFFVLTYAAYRHSEAAVSDFISSKQEAKQPSAVNDIKYGFL